MVDDGHSRAVYRAPIALNGLAIVLVELPLISITQRLRHVAVLAADLVLEGLGFGLIPISGATAWLALTLVWSRGEMVCSPVAGAYVAAISPEHLRGPTAGPGPALAYRSRASAVPRPAPVLSVSHAALSLLCLRCGLVASGLVLRSERDVAVLAPRP